MIDRINIVKMATLPKLSYEFHVVPRKLPLSYFTSSEKNNTRIHMEPKKKKHE